MSFALGNHAIGDGHPCFVTFEAGPTHDGLASAKALATAAAEAGGHAVKYQVLDPDRLVSDKKQLFSYQVLVDRETGATETVEEPLYDILCRRSLTRDEWRAVKAHCDSLNLAFFATVSFEDEIDFLVEIGCHSIKIASADVNHLPLIRCAAQTGMCVQVDTGNATIGEIEQAVDVVREAGNEKIVIHHCPSGYPARLESVNLRIIPTLKRMFDYPVAYSDHTPGWDLDIAARALGADMVEKTISFDRATRSVEHIFAVEPGEAAAFVRALADLDIAMGTRRRIMTAPEREKRDKVRRSAFFARAMSAGAIIAESDIDYRRPGDGLPPTFHQRLVGKRLAADRPVGHKIAFNDLEEA
jgi:sialic acid synthase SpsE